MPDHEQKPASGTTEEEVMSEVMERAMEGNVKLLLANEISHAKRMDILSEQAIKQTIEFSQKANDDYLEMTKQMRNAYMEQSKNQSELNNAHQKNTNHQATENNRYTLDRLYAVFPEEGVGIATMLKGLEAAGIITINNKPSA